MPKGLQLSVELGDLRRRVTVGPDGHFSVAGLPAGRAILRAEAPGYVPVHTPVDVSAAEAPGQITAPNEEIELERGGVISGEVRRPGTAVAGVEITVIDEVGDEVARVRSDRRGAFRTRPLRPGKLTLRVSGDGLDTDERVTVVAGEEVRTVLELH